MSSLSESEAEAEAEADRCCMHYSATDISPLCQRALLGHPPSSQPLHVFGDILDRVPEKLLAELKSIEQDKMLAFEQALAARSLLVAADLTKEEAESEQLGLDMVQYKAQLGQEMADLMCKKLRECSEQKGFNTTAWCVRHNKFCNLDPRTHPKVANTGVLFLEAAGPNCPPWSSMSARKDRWLSSSTLLALVWAFTTRSLHFDAVIHENAPGWDDHFTKCIFAGQHWRQHVQAQPAQPQPAQPYPKKRKRQPGDFESDYLCLQPPPICPTQFGRPSRRKRSYTVWIKSASLKLRFPAGICFLDVFEAAFHRTLRLSPSKYICAPEKHVQMRQWDAIKSNGFDIDISSACGWSALTSADAMRLQQFEELASERGLVQRVTGGVDTDTWTVDCALVNGSQYPWFSRPSIPQVLQPSCRDR